MIKIWGKVISNEKIVKSKTVSVDTENTTFFDMLSNLCHLLNIPTPVLLDKHAYDFNVFGICTFKQDDFIEEIAFDKFSLEIFKSL